MTRFLIASALVVAFLAPEAGWSPASAHAFLQKASPAVGSTVTIAPTQVLITFTEGVEPSFSHIEVRNAAGARVDDGKPIQLEGDDSHAAIGLQAKLPPGAYKVVWHVVAIDTHRTEGSFTFTVGP